MFVVVITKHIYSFQLQGLAAVTPRAADPVSMLDFYMKKAAQEEKTRRPRQSKDEMPPPASLQGPSATPSTDPEKRGHHMGDYIPLEELNKFLAKCDDVAAQKATKEAAEKAKMLADNVGHKLLSKMGWKEGRHITKNQSTCCTQSQAIAHPHTAPADLCFSIKNNVPSVGMDWICFLPLRRFSLQTSSICLGYSVPVIGNE
ncbi:hypothetical protein HID58_061243 [Brassica napus]|uniref:G-patch domain-containing protein n=3 Tax=Brassica TaxID=3705 RepID=A0ABQ7ZY18_BRANA|nr:hypothetical protein HID58_061243 [Brassica napus]VDD10460.1 unnamed protein product [Brassica oleracea]